MAKKNIQSFIRHEKRFSRWFSVQDGKIKIGCCDCALTHNFEFRVKNGVVEFRAKINRKKTDKVRKKHGVIVNKKYEKK